MAASLYFQLLIREHLCSSVAEETHMRLQPSDILYEDNHLLVVNKPAGLITQGADAGDPSLVTLAKSYLKRKYDKPGNVYLGVVSRLDAVTSGAIVLARTSKAAARLTEQFRNREVKKTYWAVVAGTPARESGEWVDHVRKDERQQRMVICDANHPQAKEARLTYRVLQQVSVGTLLEINLQTGRKHQIRLQCSSRDLPILGDRKYDSDRRFKKGIALHSRDVSLLHPVKKELLEFIAHLPAAWEKLEIN